jgi:hypothetical protein
MMAGRPKGFKHSAQTRVKIREARLGKKNSSRTTHGLTNTSIYSVWCTMKQRCYNQNRKKYKDYGLRGIKICDEWQDAAIFAEWAFSNGYQKGLQIDRIDNDGNYEPNNCRFVTPKENSRNRRNTKYLTINGETKSVAEWCEHIDISPFTVYWWIRERGVDYAEQRISAIA